MGCVAFIATFSSVVIWATQADKTQDLESLLTAATLAQARSDFSAAAECYRQAVKVSPNIPELWANLGLMDDQTGNLSEAIKSFSEAARLNGSMFVPQLFLGIEYLKLNRAETAIPFLQKAEQINPKDPQAPLALGRAFAISGKGDRSSDAYWRAVSLALGDGNAWFGLGTAELQQSSTDDRMMEETYKDSVYTKLRAGETFTEQGKLIQAADAYTSALMAKSPPPPCVHASYGIVLMRQQEVSRAHAEFDQELKLNSGCGLARLGLAAIRLMQGDTEDALQDIITLWHADRGFLQESLPLLRDGLSEDQREQLLRMASDLEARGGIPAESGDVLQTESQSDKLVSKILPEGGKSGPDSKRAAVPRVSKETETFYLSGQYQKCSESLRPRLNVLPETSLLLLAPCAFYTGDYRTASLAAQRLKLISSTRVIGLYWESKADQKSAITALTRAGETDSDSPQLHVLLGDIYRQKQRWEEAENEYRKALALEPHNQSASLGLAMALFSNGKSDEALAIDKALLMETPDDPEENLLAGEILMHSGLFTDAETYLKSIRDTGQKYMPRVHTLLGEVYAAANRVPEALSEFKLGLVNDDDGSVHYKLGRLYQKLGDKEKADEAFRVSKQLLKQSNDRVNLAPQ
jgi:tetratricopeptide (TPR) repeat protein